MANPAVTQFSGFLRAYGADFFTEADDGTKTATINTPEAVEAFEFYGKLLRDTGPDGVLSMTWTETWSLFTQGQTAMRFDANTNLGSGILITLPLLWKRSAALICLSALTVITATILSLLGRWASAMVLPRRMPLGL